MVIVSPASMVYDPKNNVAYIISIRLGCLQPFPATSNSRGYGFEFLAIGKPIINTERFFSGLT